MNNDLKNKLAKKQESLVNNKDKNSIEALICKMQPEILKALPKHLTVDRFSRIALTSLRMNPELLKCNQTSLLGALMQSAQLGLEPGVLGQAYLIPYNNRKLGTTECQFQIGYKGLIELVRRSGYVKTIYANEICENDELEYSFGVDGTFIHKPLIKGDRGEIIAYYAIVKTKDNEYIYSVMSKTDVEKHRNQYAKGYEYASSPWKTAFDEMAKKTVLKKLIKNLPLSSEIIAEIKADETVKTEIKEDMVNESFDIIENVSSENLGVVEAVEVEYKEDPPAENPLENLNFEDTIK